MSDNAAVPPAGPRRLYRDPQRRAVAGVAAGIAGHLGLPVIVVRVAFCALIGVDGVGALLYAVFWAVLPVAPDRTARPRDLQTIIPIAVIGVGVLLLEGLIGISGGRSVIGWLVALVAFGAGVIWHQSDTARRVRFARSPAKVTAWWNAALVDSDGRVYVLRLVGGGALVSIGVVGAIAVLDPTKGAGFSALVNGLIFSLVALSGVGLVAAPLIWRMFTQLRTEREGRIREQERAEIAAVVHDQVLHTLALIQRNAGDSRAVVKLARGQERTLRNWLYKPAGSPSERFAALLEAVAGEVEDAYAIVVEAVVVGDRQVDEPVAALVAAVREATVNAARHSGVSTVSLYAEVEPDKISVFVRDRGSGFDLSTVEESRHGVSGSIIGRMKRHGGTAEIRSEPGEGTEVRLTIPVAPAPEPADQSSKAA